MGKASSLEPYATGPQNAKPLTNGEAPFEIREWLTAVRMLRLRVSFEAFLQLTSVSTALGAKYHRMNI